MSLKTNLKSCFFKCYNEAVGVNIHKNKILAHKKPNHLNLFSILLIVTSFVFLVSILLLLKGFIPGGCFLIFLDLVIIFSNLLNCLYRYFTYRKKNFQSTIIFDEEGLTDTSFMDIKMTFKWSKLKALVVKKHTLVILTDTPCYFYFNKELEPLLLKTLTKYCPNLLIIQK